MNKSAAKTEQNNFEQNIRVSLTMKMKVVFNKDVDYIPEAFLSIGILQFEGVVERRTTEYL